MIIAITGKKRSGKDICGDHLVEKYGFVKYSFAEPIKEMCKIVFLWDERHTEGELKEVIDERWGITPREAFQTIGTELFRENFPKLHKQFHTLIDNNIWVKRFVFWYTLNKDKNVVITDLRFLNEAKIIKEMGGDIIRIISPVDNDDAHKSEMEMDQIKEDCIIHNDDYSIDYIKSWIGSYLDGVRDKIEWK